MADNNIIPKSMLKNRLNRITNNNQKPYPKNILNNT